METESQAYIVLEFIQGGDLFDAIAEQVNFSEKDAATIVHDTCCALGLGCNRNLNQIS